MASEQERLESLVAQQELLIQRAFRAFLRDVRSEEVMREISNYLERRDVEGALRIVDGYVIRFGNVIPRAYQRAARAESESAAAKLATLAPAVAISFDPTDARAAAAMRRNQLQFIRDFSQEQKATTREALAQAFVRGEGPIGSARAFRASIGLTQRQLKAVDRYSELLRSSSSEALSRDLRDRRYDRTVRSSIRSGEPLDRATILRMTERYRERYLMLRSETIARTESVRVVSQARRDVFQQTVQDLGLDRRKIVRVWNATKDKRTRDSHITMDGQEVALEEPFTSGAGHKLMFPGDPSAPAEETINCRCVVTNRVL